MRDVSETSSGERKHALPGKDSSLFAFCKRICTFCVSLFFGKK